MFGLTFDKLLLIAIITGVIIGPSRLPVYTRQLTDVLQSFKRFVEATRARAEQDMGASLTRAEWEALDPRRYDPRQLVREALTVPDNEPVAAAEPAGTAIDSRILEAADIRPGQRYLVSGSASHPRRILIASLPEDDPRRIAAEVGLEPEVVPQPAEQDDRHVRHM